MSMCVRDLAQLKMPSNVVIALGFARPSHRACDGGALSSQVAWSHIRRGPDALTAYFANGGQLDEEESSWVDRHLSTLRASGSLASPGDGISLKDLKSIYLGARVIQGSVIASQLALPAVIEAGEIVRHAALPADLDSYAQLGAAQTELYLSGAHQGTARAENDYPAEVKRYIAAIAGILNGPYDRAYQRLQQKRPELWALALDADELQRLCWGLMRWRINEVIPADQLAVFRAKPLQDGTDELLALIKERTGVSLPPRVVQRDSQDYIDPREDWQAALRKARQDPQLAVLSGMRFSVENAEIATLYGLGSLLMRISHGSIADEALRQQIRFGAQDIAWGTHLVTHNARFQSRLGARPTYYRSFSEFLRNVSKQTGASAMQHDGRIDYFDTHSPQVRGWCPAQNQYDGKQPDGLAGYAKDGQNAIASWKEYAQSRFGVAPEYSEATVGELLASVVLFVTLHEGSPLRPDSALVRELTERLA